MLVITSGTRGKQSKGPKLIVIGIERQKNFLQGDKPIAKTYFAKGAHQSNGRNFQNKVTPSDRPVEPSRCAIVFNRHMIYVGEPRR